MGRKEDWTNFNTNMSREKAEELKAWAAEHDMSRDAAVNMAVDLLFNDGLKKHFPTVLAISKNSSIP